MPQEGWKCCSVSSVCVADKSSELHNLGIVWPYVQSHTWEAEAGASGIQSYLWLRNKLNANLGYMIFWDHVSKAKQNKMSKDF